MNSSDLSHHLPNICYLFEDQLKLKDVHINNFKIYTYMYTIEADRTFGNNLCRTFGHILIRFWKIRKYSILIGFWWSRCQSKALGTLSKMTPKSLKSDHYIINCRIKQIPKKRKFCWPNVRSVSTHDYEKS